MIGSLGSSGLVSQYAYVQSGASTRREWSTNCGAMPTLSPRTQTETSGSASGSHFLPVSAQTLGSGSGSEQSSPSLQRWTVTVPLTMR